MSLKLSFSEAFFAETDDSRIKACFLLKKRVSQTNNVYFHWAIALQGRTYFHLLEFSSSQMIYSYFKSLEECAENMMGDNIVVYVYKVKPEKYLRRETSDQVYEFFAWTFNQLKTSILNDFKFFYDNSNFLALNSQNVCEYLISVLRGWEKDDPITTKHFGLEESLKNSIKCDYKIFLENKSL